MQISNCELHLPVKITAWPKLISTNMTCTAGKTDQRNNSVNNGNRVIEYGSIDGGHSVEYNSFGSVEIS